MMTTIAVDLTTGIKETINNNLEVVLEAAEAIEVVAKILIRIATVRI